MLNDVCGKRAADLQLKSTLFIGKRSPQDVVKNKGKAIADPACYVFSYTIIAMLDTGLGNRSVHHQKIYLAFK